MASIDVWLRAVPSDADPHDVRLYTKPDTGSGFPAQFSGLRYFHGTVRELCLVATADAPIGDSPRIRKGGTTYAIYLVDTTDPNASTVRMRTNDGTRAIRNKT